LNRLVGIEYVRMFVKSCSTITSDSHQNTRALCFCITDYNLSPSNYCLIYRNLTVEKFIVLQ